MNHQYIDERSLWLARIIAERLREHPEMWAKPREFMARHGDSPIHGVRIWKKIMRKPPEVILAIYLRDDEKGRQIRQSAPFAGVLDPEERNRLFAEFREMKGLPPASIRGWPILSGLSRDCVNMVAGKDGRML